MNERIMEGKLKGYCCAQIIMEYAIDRMEMDQLKDNEAIMTIMGTLCGGLKHGSTCGILSGAMCALNLADHENFLVNEGDILWDWFEEAFGSTNCAELLGNDPEDARLNLCPAMMDAMMNYLDDILD